MARRISTAEVQRFCKPKVGSSNLSSGTIRRATRKDLDDIVYIERASFKDRAFSRKKFAYYVVRKQIHVVSDNNAVVGYIVVFTRSRSRVARINVVAVHPQYTGKGYGSLLLYYIEKKYGNQYDAISLEVNIHNTGAHRLYRSLGYESIKMLDDFYGKGQHGIKMIKYLR